MFSACHKSFPVKIIAAGSGDLLQRNHLLLSSCKFQCFVNLCSVADASSSGLPSETKSKSCKKVENDISCTVSFLINSCGLTPEMAVSVSDKVRFENTEKPNFVVAALKKYGFSRKQIADIVCKKPNILRSKEKTLVPKLEFLQSVGFPMARLAALIAKNPSILSSSVQNNLIPSYNFLKSVLLTDERVAVAMKQSSRIFQQNPNKNIAPNVAVLRELEVPEPSIVLLLTHYPETFVERTNDFKESVNKVLEMGFHPSRSTFVLALHVVAEKGNRGIWDRCYETYRSWGWSEDDVYLAFRRHPNCMIMSQNKISRVMDFFVNKMGWDSQMVLVCPAVLLYNLENRIVPRCTVVQALLSKGLIAKEIKLSCILQPPEYLFLERFVARYEKDEPKLYDVYKGKIDLKELCDL
ncbi:Mitochondrial transcription termination factor family protein [Dorcoceras hygrometricum]|uniref:Mitochondrial transcription termination factor family protein n=1 Tax=Dorcoceras hygrometricum TaxID=472368 RepID=A0A2Z7DAD9_9LAMI|nr:Mitochondrial transcription termination factor family protein [Dorcoceras hygrometricum]